MILARFHTEALTRVRFAISPMFEMMRSIKALKDPASAALHLPWVEQALPACRRPRPARRCSRCSPRRIYNPDFVHPPPSSPLVEFEDELAVMVSTPPRQIAAEIRYAFGDGPAAAGARAVRAAAEEGDRSARRADAGVLGANPRRPLAAAALAARARRPLSLAADRRRRHGAPVLRPRPVGELGGRRADGSNAASARRT